MNVNALNERIDKSGLKLGFISEQMGVTRVSLWNKLSGKTAFTVEDAAKLSQVLNLTLSEKNDIFFK